MVTSSFFDFTLIMIIDSHTHLADKDFIDIDLVLKNAKSVGVDYVISIGCSLSEASKSLEMAQKYKNVFSTIGLYPHDNGDKNERELTSEARLLQVNEILMNEFEGEDIDVNERENEEIYKKGENMDNVNVENLRLSRKKKVSSEKENIDNSTYDRNIVAIGECGLDFTEPPPWEIKRSRKEQEFLFRKQIDLARKYDLPLIIHSRSAVNDTLAILNEEMNKKRFKAVWHCYTESLETSKILLDLGIFISFTGILTYKNSDNVRDVAEYVPLNHIMVETDSPFLVPYNARKKGVKVNEPKYVLEIVEKLADIKDVNLNEISEILTRNTIDFFNLPI